MRYRNKEQPMIEGPICQDQVFVHIESQVSYIALNGNSDGEKDITTIVKIGEAKSDVPCEQDPDWIPCIVYYNPEKGEHLFVRDETTFRKKFERVTG
jgi:hypothetical protein